MAERKKNNFTNVCEIGRPGCLLLFRESPVIFFIPLIQYKTTVPRDVKFPGVVEWIGKADGTGVGPRVGDNAISWNIPYQLFFWRAKTEASSVGQSVFLAKI